MNGVLGNISAMQGYTRLGKSWANEMNFDMNHVPGAGMIATPVRIIHLCHHHQHDNDDSDDDDDDDDDDDNE